MKKKRYVTIDEGVDFRSIAKIMSANGYKMNHATARNVLMTAIKRLLHQSATQIGVTITPDKINSLVKDQNLHGALAEILYKAHKLEKGKENGD